MIQQLSKNLYKTIGLIGIIGSPGLKVIVQYKTWSPVKSSIIK